MGKSRSDRFKSTKGHLALSKGKHTHKFCSECTLMMISEAQRLRTHYGGHHPNQKPRWLGFDETPPTTIYSNFEEFLADPEVELKKKEDLKNGLRGRPEQRDPPKP